MELSLLEHAKKLFPLCRSITGNGLRKTLEYFEELHPQLSRIKFSSGEEVFDWVIPKEWNINNAYIQHLDTGKKFADFSECNLHVVGYSEPINLVMDLESLKSKIYTQPNQPNWIPYVTSYYKQNWGFCMSEKDKNNLPRGKYKVVIDSSLEDGFLELSHAIIQGSTNQEIFFSSYVCHPSMANNELSGPVLLSGILDYIKKKYKRNRYTYRFVLLPETIGSIAYLSLHSKVMKKNIICGFNLSCVGDERSYSHVQSAYGNTLSDEALSSALKGLENVKTYSYLERGSDERQYCSPGIDLPLCTFCRTKFGEYPEYHTSADDFSVVTENGLNGSLEIMKSIVDAFELGLNPLVRTFCEPQLGKRGLYPNLSQKTTNERHPAQTRMDIIAYCNGSNTIFDICKLTGLSLKEVINEIHTLLLNGLLINTSHN